MGKHLLTVQETWVQSLGWEDLLEKEMKTHSSMLAWIIPGTEEPGKFQSIGSQRVGHNWATSLYFFSFFLSFLKVNSPKLPLLNSRVWKRNLVWAAVFRLFPLLMRPCGLWPPTHANERRHSKSPDSGQWKDRKNIVLDNQGDSEWTPECTTLELFLYEMT